MKLLYITNQISGSGGLERVLAIKTRILIENYGYEIHLITLNQGSQTYFFNFSGLIKTHDIIVNGSFINYIKTYIFGIKKVVKDLNPDLILVCDDGLKGFFLPLILDNCCPIIYERHVSKQVMFNEKDSYFQILKSNITFLLMNLLAKSFNKFVVLTNNNTHEWKTKNIEVIPNPLTFYPEFASSLENKTVIAVGKQSYQKGYDRLLKSWQIINKKNPDWILKIYGKLDESQGLDNLAKKLNIQDSVYFFDAEKNIQEKLLEASIFVLTSRFEGFGMVLIEAMACGLPIVSFDCPCGPKDIIKNNIDGFLVPNDDINLFANQVNLLIENKELRQKFSKNARENVKRFSTDIVLEKWNDLIKKTIGSRSIST
jgi:glycosyltransferase involved in cell wall biosynthesis